MNINITVDQVDLTAAIGEMYDSDLDRRRPTTLGEAVAEQIVRELMKTDDWRGAKAEVERIRKEIIREKVAAEIAAVLAEPIQKTNGYGELIGGTTTIRAEVAAMAAEALKHGDRYNGNEGAVRKVLREEVNLALVKDFKAAIDEEKAKLIAAARAKAAEMIAEAARQFVGIPK